MLNYVVLSAIVVIGYVSYTGEDLTEEYDSISEIRTIAWNGVIDPFVKDILKQASESNLDEILENMIQKYGEKDEMQNL